MTIIAVIGLGYVGLPPAVEFGKKFETLGFDLSADKVAAYARHVDPTGEVSTEDLRAATGLTCSTDPAVIGNRDAYQKAVREHAELGKIVTVFRRYREVARSMGKGITEFKKGIKGEGITEPSASIEDQRRADERRVD